ncbi:MAG: phytoene desaturase family protein [Candidatus Helarchaeota archaeon]
MNQSGFDALIVGGGVGGTAIGALLASSGKKVALFEKNKIIGGRCLSYEHQGFLVDLGVHLFGVGDKGYIGDVLRKINRPTALEWVISKDPRPTMFYNGKMEVYSRKNMSAAMGTSKEDFELAMKFFTDCLSMRKKQIKELYYTGLTDFINKYSTNPTLHVFVAMIAAQYFCTDPRVTSAGEFIRCFRQVVNSKSSAYPKGACIAIPKAFQQAIEDNGGKIHLDTTVKKIIVENGRAIGIELKDGTTLNAKIIISNADIQNTVQNLVGEEHFPEDYVKRVKNLTYATHCLALKVGLDEKVTDQKLIMYVRESLSDPAAIQETTTIDMKSVRGGMITSPTNYDEKLAPAGNQLIFFGTACPGGRPEEEYKKFGEKCYEALLQVIPTIEDHVLWKKVDSPNLIEAYAGEYGNIIGVGQTIDQIAERRPSQKSPIEGLYIVGAEAGGHGIGAELAANSAMELFEMLQK